MDKSYVVIHDTGSPFLS